MTTKVQAISGVNATSENEVMTVYPSVGASGFGRFLGALYDSIPVKINGVKLSHLIFPLPCVPFALLIYAVQKAFGQSFQLTNRAVKVWKMSLGARGNLVSQVALDDIDRIEIVTLPGQEFYKASDLVLVHASGGLLARLSGIPRAQVFRATILKARDARMQTAASLERIEARQTA